MTTPLKIGIALGGGAARGWSHIGVLKALKHLGIEPEIVAGASIGSLAGAAFAGGKLDILEQWTRSLTRMDVLGLLDARFRGGVFRGSRVMSAVSEQLGNDNIENLPIAYGAVAADLITGREIWLRKGDVMTAVRASCGLPGMFSPTRHEGRWLIDGGVVNPVPVSLCYALGADAVIAVNLNAHLASRRRLVEAKLSTSQTPPAELSRFERLASVIGSLFSRSDSEPGIFDVVNASINIMQERITRSRMAGEPPNVEIRPAVQDIELMDFHRADETIRLGEEAVSAVERDLKELLLEPG